MSMTSLETVRALTPEIILLVTAVVVYLGGTFNWASRWFRWTALGGCAVAVWTLTQVAPLATGESEQLVPLLNGPLRQDQLAAWMRWGAIGLTFLFVLLGWKPVCRKSLGAEYLGSALLVGCGMMVTASANDLVLLVVGLEMVSIPSYVLIALGRARAQTQEAATKYFLLSVLSSAILFYGIAFLYGISGSTTLTEISAALQDSGAESAGGLYGLIPLAMVLIVCGLCFKLAAVPFHFYTPDVYQGTSAASAGILAVAPKVVGVLAAVRILMLFAPAALSQEFAWQLIMAISVVTMTLGNVLALLQKNVRRMLAYSSVAHGGYLLIGIAVAFAMSGDSVELPAESMGGVAATLTYLAVYCVGTLGMFAALAYLTSENDEINTLEQLGQVARRYPSIAIAIAVFMFSLIGVPPLAGFWGKLALVTSALSVTGPAASAVPAWFQALAIITVLNAAISAGYYLRVVGALFFSAPQTQWQAKGGPSTWWATVACAVTVIAIGISPGALIGPARVAADSTVISPKVLVPARAMDAGDADSEQIVRATPTVQPRLETFAQR